ncbi:peptidoglycan editing factor PgeF [Kaistia terrae]|uniref:Purine nucleoside phosphorylase n=1 Tax=Kaistia terrae TaxID=537017 RepID=A0ABW0PTD1_9HYPH|nr:peptidoglycan editing factor PgeF [Kaistia terrae]MCX5578032.1 peptidoglycan editing factor PgeF [Kaistia terrae]
MKITADALEALPGIRHGFFTRQGGVSQGIYGSLNCGVGSADERAHVLENRARVTADLGVAARQLATPYQVHSPDVVVVDQVWATGDGPKADAVVTNRAGIAIGVGTADCGPVLFADGEAGVVGAAHAGWKGAFTGVLEATVAAMEGLGARRENIVAVLGPTISKAAYEVGPEFRARFLDVAETNAAYFTPSARADHHQFDLPSYIGMRLRAAGLGTVGDLALCTYADPTRFFSYRRTTHAGEPDYGRLLHAITIAG